MNWISVYDRLPESDGLYIIYDGSVRIGEFKMGCVFMNNDCSVNRKVTHWLPLPPPPTEWPLDKDCLNCKHYDHENHRCHLDWVSCLSDENPFNMYEPS